MIGCSRIWQTYSCSYCFKVWKFFPGAGTITDLPYLPVISRHQATEQFKFSGFIRLPTEIWLSLNSMLMMCSLLLQLFSFFPFQLFFLSFPFPPPRRSPAGSPSCALLGLLPGSIPLLQLCPTFPLPTRGTFPQLALFLHAPDALPPGSFYRGLLQKVFLILSQCLSLFLLPHVLGSCATQNKGKKKRLYSVREEDKMLS